MPINRRRISMREGEVYVNGTKILDAVKLEAVFTPEVNESRSLNERHVSRRWIGWDITGTITEYRSTPWLREAIDGYMANGVTPEMTISGIMNDQGSEYYEGNGNISVTLSGVVFTGDIPLINLDSEGDVMQDEIEFGAAGLS